MSPIKLKELYEEDAKVSVGRGGVDAGVELQEADCEKNEAVGGDPSGENLVQVTL